MSLLEEIRRQPEPVRHLMMWLCVIVVFSLISFVWFKSTQARFVAMLYPQESQQEENVLDNFALRSEENKAGVVATQSPLAGIWNTFSLLRASISELITGEKSDISVETNQPAAGADQERQEDGFRILPLSRDR